MDAPLFSSAVEEPPRRSGFSVWLAAAVALVIGIVIGFASGYRAGRNVTAETQVVGQPQPPAAAPRPSGQTFSESAVTEPPRPEAPPVAAAKPAASPASKPAAQPSPKPVPPKTAAQAAPKPVPAKPAAAPTPKPAVTARETAPAPITKPAAPAPRPATAPRTAAPAPAASAAPAAPAATGPGSLEVVSRPAGANVIVDGNAAGRTPLTIGEIAAGRHTVRLEMPGYQQWQTTVEIKPRASTRVAASLEQ
jgi:outer membrane biosynthesis protein TonB